MLKKPLAAIYLFLYCIEKNIAIIKNDVEKMFYIKYYDNGNVIQFQISNDEREREIVMASTCFFPAFA